MAPVGPVDDEGVPPDFTNHAKSAELWYIGEASQQLAQVPEPYPTAGAHGALSKFSTNGVVLVTAVGEHLVVAVPALLQAEVSPTAQISLTSTEYVVLADRPVNEAGPAVPELYV